MAKSIHFRNIEDTVNAVKSTGYEAWSVWEQNLLLCKGIGTDDLQQFLDLLSDGGTNAIYTVKYYAKIADKDDIKNNTAHDGAFNFKMNGDGQEITQAQYGSIKHSNELQNRVSGIEAKIDLIAEALERDTDEVEEKPNRLGIIGEIMAHPSIAPIMPRLIESFLGALQPQQQPQRIPMPAIASVGNIPADNELQAAIDKLKTFDPKLSEHLTKLAIIAEQQPQTFKMILNSLDSF